jgi:hypothetical protein
MASAQSPVLIHLAQLRKGLNEKRDRIREELAALGNEPRRLSSEKRSAFTSAGLSVRLLDDLESQMLAGAADDLPGVLSQLVGLFKQLQSAALPGNATPAQGLPVTAPAPRTLSGSGRSVIKQPAPETETTKPGLGHGPVKARR